MAGTIQRIATLEIPTMMGTFEGTPYAYLNGAAWTIRFEFGCYLLVILLGLAGMLVSARRLWLVAAVLLVAHAVLLNGGAAAIGMATDGTTGGGAVIQELRLGGLFVAGAAVRPHLDAMTFTGFRLIAALAILCLSIMSPVTATIGCATAGAYLVFGAGVLGGRTMWHRVNDKTDISYGLYLYGWPVEKVILWSFPAINIVVAGVATWLIAAAMGLASWLWVEKPMLELARGRH